MSYDYGNYDHDFHFGVVGEGPDATIAAFGSSLVAGVPESEQKAWACPTCTFWNTETMGKFCSMCGGRRFPGNECAAAPPQTQAPAQYHTHSGMEHFENSESADTLGDSPFTFSPLPGDKKKLGSISEVARASSHGRNNGLEKSFSVFGLLEDESYDEFGGDSPRKDQKPALNAKDFQMSFANWSVSDQGAWTCPSCTFVNTNPLHLQCEICCQSRPAKNTAIQNQKVMQDMMETSFRTGQKDFLRQQQERIEEIEERVLAAERIKEITELQAEMLGGYEEQKWDTKEAPRYAAAPAVGASYEMAQKAKMAEEYIDDLERARQKEFEEQQKMEALLHERRSRLGMERMSTERCLQNGPFKVTSEQSQIRAQEKLLSQWKQSYRKKEADIAAIRERQNDILNRWQR